MRRWRASFHSPRVPTIRSSSILILSKACFALLYAAAFVVVAITIAVGWGGSASYLATPARLSEIIIGAVLAVAIHEGRRIPASRWLAGAGLVVIA